MILPGPKREKATVAPPPVMLLLLASRARTVITWLLVPLATRVAVPGEIVERVASAAPGEKTMFPLVTAVKAPPPEVRVAVRVMVSAAE